VWNLAFLCKALANFQFWQAGVPGKRPLLAGVEVGDFANLF
jgi:hypothetical protein